jgi:hypothetical protein
MGEMGFECDRSAGGKGENPPDGITGEGPEDAGIHPHFFHRKVVPYLSRYRLYFLAPLVLFLLVTLVLVLLSSGPQRGPFIYLIR